MSPLAKAQSNYQSYVFDFIELRVAPESSDILRSSIQLFTSEQKLVSILDDDDFLCWNSLGPYDLNFDFSDSISSFGMVLVNESGFYEFIAALTSDNLTLLWIEELPGISLDTFIIALNSSVQFFADQSKYWGVCEEIIILPGASIDLEPHRVWKFQYLLTEDSERWILYIDSEGQIIDSAVVEIPCQSCTLCTTVIILGISFSLVVIAVIILILRGRMKHH